MRKLAYISQMNQFWLHANNDAIWQILHYMSETVFCSSCSNLCCHELDNSIQFSIHTCSVTFCAVSKSCSPSGKTSGSTIGTRPFWNIKLIVWVQWPKYYPNLKFNSQLLAFIQRIQLPIYMQHIKISPVDRYWHIWLGHWHSLT